jgi:hypothetical protein
MATWKSWVIVAALASTACDSTSHEDGGASENTHRDASAATSDASSGGPDEGGATLDSDATSRTNDGAVPILPSPPAAVGSGALTNIDGLPFLFLGEQSRHSSSYDRTQNNIDFGNAYGIDASGNSILLDARTPGCVYRIWFTGFATTDQIHFYFDDETTPRISMPLLQLFSGTSPPFTAPLAGDAFASSGGFYSYVPLPFAKSLRITATPDTRLYYNIDYHTLPPDAVVSTWTGQEDLSVARAVWGAPGTDPRVTTNAGNDERTTFDTSFDLMPAQTQKLFDGEGPAELTSLELHLPGLMALPVAGSADGGSEGGADTSDAEGLDAGALGPLADVLGQLWIGMAWDDEPNPSVLATVGSLFALGDLGAGASGGLMAGMRADGTLYLYFPMPFFRHARVTITNYGSTPVTGLWASVKRQPFPYSFDQVGTFAVNYSVVNSTSAADLTLLDTAGSGKVVGVVVTESRATCSNCTVRDYLEGNEHILVDGARTPVVLGTGTEDFFNGGFYFYEGPFGLPSQGNVVHAATPNYDATAMYRFFLSDPISFRNHVRVSLQHGPTDNDAVSASSLIYYYRQARLRLVLNDALIVGDATSEQQHLYEINDATWSGSLSATWEGEFSAQSMTATGRSHKGSSSFILQIDPANRGVTLRRMLNQGTGNQNAQVFVNGALVGTWYCPGSNLSHAWREEDFALPASMTANKSALLIEIRFVSSDVDWTEFEYDSYSLLP